MLELRHQHHRTSRSVFLFVEHLVFVLQESVADLEGKVKELEGFCTEALDELDRERAKNA